MSGTVYKFPVRRPPLSAPDKKMMESLRRLSVQADAFAKQTQIFTEKVAAVNEACQKARILLEHA